MSEHQIPPELPRPPGPPPPLPGRTPAAPAGPAPHRGVVILVLGVCSLVTGCFLLGIIAWSMGNRDLLAIEEGRMDPEGLGLTRAGRIVGMVHVIFTCIALLVGLIVTVAFGLSILEAGR